jgi:anthranilate phosphoribosyltransferase
MPDMPDLKTLLAKVATGASLTVEEAERAFDVMMSGNATPAQMGGFLMALRVRGETVAEITGAARTMRAKAAHVRAPADAIDIVGTGGDGIGTWNISTAAAFVVAGCGIPVAKHGNRAFSSRSGAADVLTELGLDMDTAAPNLERALQEAGIAFLLAPRHHGAMRNVGPTRVELGTRTIFNILGPLSNPALVNHMMVGAFDRAWIRPMAETLGNLGTEAAWVVHGADGLDEVSTTGVTHVAELRGGTVREFDITPEDAGLPRTDLPSLKGGTPAETAAALRALLAGERGPYRDIVLMNSAAALVVAGKASDLKAGVAQATASIDDGRASGALKALLGICGRTG